MKRSSVWKTVELKIARFLGGDRNPITGRVRDNTLPDIGKAKIPLKVLPDLPDFGKLSTYSDSEYIKILNGKLFDTYNFEIKHRKDLPKWLVELGNSAKTDIPVIVYDNVIVTTLDHFRNFHLEGQFFSDYRSDGELPSLDIPAWLLDAKNQADMSGDGKKSVVILHAKNKKIKDSIVLIWSK